MLPPSRNNAVLGLADGTCEACCSDAQASANLVTEAATYTQADVGCSEGQEHYESDAIHQNPHRQIRVTRTEQRGRQLNYQVRAEGGPSGSERRPLLGIWQFGQHTNDISEAKPMCMRRKTPACLHFAEAVFEDPCWWGQFGL